MERERLEELLAGGPDRVDELTVIVDRLRLVMDEARIPLWLTTPIPVLDDRRPTELIAAGEARRVVAVVASLEYGGTV